ncbi:hypothetical protein P7K49_014544, partial [Saguinus oedipus]
KFQARQCKATKGIAILRKAIPGEERQGKAIRNKATLVKTRQDKAIPGKALPGRAMQANYRQRKA